MTRAADSVDAGSSAGHGEIRGRRALSTLDSARAERAADPTDPGQPFGADGAAAALGPGVPAWEKPWTGALGPLGRPAGGWLTPARTAAVCYLAGLLWFGIAQGLPAGWSEGTVWMVAGLVAVLLAPGWAWLTPGRLGLTSFVVMLVWFSATQGIPIDRIGQTVWILVGILGAGLERTWRQHLRVVADWLPLLGALVLYDHTRGIADSLGMPLRVEELVDAERWLFGGELPTLWLQDRLYDATQVHWWDVGVAIVYCTHFVLPWTIAAVLYLWSRPEWVSYIRRVLLLSYAGLLTYILLPSAPPWYAAREGIITGDVERISTRGWWEIGLSFADTWLSGAQAQSNHVAAMPSLHAAFALLATVALWPYVWRLGRSLDRWDARRMAVETIRWALLAVLALFPLAMAFSLVYSGEHYTVDVLTGWLYVGLVCLIARWWERRRAGAPDMGVCLRA